MANGTINNIKNIWINKAKSLGYTEAASLLNNLYQKEFEYYSISFELCDSKGKTLDYLSFPIMPRDIQIKESSSVQIQSTFGGVSVMSSDIFIPKEITLAGDFGRNFKIIYRKKITIPIFHGTQWERDYGGISSKSSSVELNNNIKTGYGICKVFQSILNRSLGIDKYGEPNQLFFYNLSFGESYLVKYTDLSYHQSYQNNGIWEYNARLMAICPLNLISNKSKNFNIYDSVKVQSGLNILTSGLRNTLLSVKSPINI